MLVKPPTSHTEFFMKNNGGSDELKLLKEPKQWDMWQRVFLSIAHSYNFKDITDPCYVLDPTNTDDCTLFNLQQKHTFGLLVSTLKELSMLPVVQEYCDLNAADYGNTHMLY